MSALALALLLLAPQDPADKVRGLVEQLARDEIAEREKAAAEILKLGPAALPALRDHVAKADGEMKARLQWVVKKLDREARLEKMMNVIPTVTLKLSEAPVEDALSEMARQTGLKVEGFFLDSTFRTSVTLDRVPLWKAIDDLCRAHGGLVGKFTSNRVVVEPGSRVGSPLIVHRGLGLHFRQAFRSEKGRLELHAVLSHAPTLPLWSTKLEVEELTDDKGTSMSDPDPESPIRFGSKFGGPTRPDQFATIVVHRTPAPPSPEATKIARARGRIVAGLAVDLKPLVILSNPMKQAESKGSGNGFALTIKSERTGSSVRIRITSLTLPGEERSDLDVFGAPQWIFGLRDDRGELHLGRALGRPLQDRDVMRVEATVPEGREIASFELLEPEEITEVIIPFDFRDIPLR